MSGWPGSARARPGQGDEQGAERRDGRGSTAGWERRCAPSWVAFLCAREVPRRTDSPRADGDESRRPPRPRRIPPRVAPLRSASAHGGERRWPPPSASASAAGLHRFDRLQPTATCPSPAGGIAVRGAPARRALTARRPARPGARTSGGRPRTPRPHHTPCRRRRRSPPRGSSRR